MPIHGRLPGILGVTAYALKLRGVVASIANDYSRNRMADLLSSVAAEFSRVCDKVGFVKMVRFWTYYRLTADLQARLFFEQVFSNKGPPWSNLVTGFGPIRKLGEGAKQLTPGEVERRRFSTSRRKSYLNKRNKKRRRLVRHLRGR